MDHPAFQKKTELDVSVIICTKDRAEDLRQTLAAIKQICIPDHLTVELIVVDNGSLDQTATVIQEAQSQLNLPVRGVAEPNRGLSHARNTGMAEARGAILLFTDDDVRPPPQWITLMCAPLLAGKADAVAGDVVIAPHLERPWMHPVHHSYLAAHEGKVNEATVLTGANMGFARDVLNRVPQFDIELGAGRLGCYEESLFSLQLERAGYRVVEVLDATVEHHFHSSRLSRSSFLATAKSVGRSQGYMQYHWEHKTQPHLSVRRLRKELQLFLRSRGQGEAHTAGADPWELSAVSHLSLLRQFAVEQKRPRNYTQYGLIKRT